MSKKVISTGGAPEAIGPYSQAILSGDLLFCSGQIGLDPSSGELADGLEGQVQRALQNLGAVLDAGGAGFDDVVKTTVFLSSMEHFAAMNEIYSTFFSGTAPARSTVAARSLPKDALFEIDAIARVRIIAG
ncbi:MAG: RidA family protein [Actinomycetota bacterium]|nr:RidA family protein [Actinomycetota bacterium]